MKFLNQLKTICSGDDLIRLIAPDIVQNLGCSYNIIDEIHLRSSYITFEIPKKHGTTNRRINAPQGVLREIQKDLSIYLTKCLDEIEEKKQYAQISFAFRKHKSIYYNAELHTRCKWIINIDLEDFFPSINFGRVRGFFIKDRNFELSNKVATAIARITCHENQLPQGSPCSPIISELITHILDVRLINFAKKNNLIYSRYADDITFSTTREAAPNSAARLITSPSYQWQISEKLRNIIERAGFEINESKFRVQSNKTRQIVTGLVVNKKVNVTNNYYRIARAACDNIFKNGTYFIKGKTTETSDMKYILGIMNYIYDIKHRNTDIEAGFFKLFRKLLFYRYFLNYDKVIIVTEGETDTIHLTYALQNLSKSELTSKKTIVSLLQNNMFNFFSHKKRHSEILGITGGSDKLKNIVLDYKNYLYGKSGVISKKDARFPVIILLDNDDGLKPVASTTKSAFGVEFNKHSTDKFYHITDNLYVVKIPFISGKTTVDTCIEDLYPDNLKKIKIKGKTFTQDNNFDEKLYFGKMDFANKIVTPNQSKIDYSGFEPLLECIRSVIDHYKALSI